MSYVDRVTKIRVDVELLNAVVARLAEQTAGQRPLFEARALCILAVVSERGWCGKPLGILATAIEFRLTALARLLNEKGAVSLTSASNIAGATWTHAELVRCAAEEPLVDQDDQPTFDPDSFERRLLAMTAVQGRV